MFDKLVSSSIVRTWIMLELLSYKLLCSSKHYNNIKYRPARTVTTSSDQVDGLPINIKTPHHTTMAIECTQAFSIQRPPHVRFGILRRWEQQVSFAVILDLGYGTFVPLQHQRFLRENRHHHKQFHGYVISIALHMLSIIDSIINDTNIPNCFRITHHFYG